MAERSDECGDRNGLLVQGDLSVPAGHVQLGEVPGLSDVIEQVFYSWQREWMGNCDGVDFTEVSTEP